MFSPLRHLTDANAQLQGGLAAAENAFAMLDEPSEHDGGREKMARAKGTIRFEDVSLQYHQRPQPALRTINLSIESGKTYAFVGPSGGGKTSLMSLLPRLYEPTTGCIYIDDTPISTISLRSLRQQLALVSQDVVLFNDTIRNNIAYGRDDLTDSQVTDAVARANLSSFIESLPDGLETIVGGSRRSPLRGATTAYCNCPRDYQGRTHSHPRRGHVRPRQPLRAGCPGVH